MGDFRQCLARTRVWEGGNDDDPDDPGGRTSRGILQSEYDAFCDRRGKPRGDVWQASEEDIAAIYYENFWTRVYGDRLDAGVAMCLFDIAVNNGVAQSAKFTQRALGDLYTGAVDGDFGPKTLAALAKVNDNDALIGRICEMRQGLFQAIAARRPASRKYLGGWSARNRDILKVSQAWATGSVGPDPHVLAGVVPVPRAKPTDIPVPLVSQSHTNAMTLVGGVGTALAAAAPVASQVGQVATDVSQQLQPVAALWPVVGTVCAVLAAVGALAGLYVAYTSRRHAEAVSGVAAAPVL